MRRPLESTEAQFKTLKYRPDFPRQFGGQDDARSFCQRFSGWYNGEHRPSGIGFHTPADLHYGPASRLRERRADVLAGAYAPHPERFVHQPAVPPSLPVATWINRPKQEAA